MAYPAGVSLAIITSGNAFSAFGGDEGLTATVTPVFPRAGGGTLRRIVHEPTGWVMSDRTDEFRAGPGEGISFSVPHVDQAGFRDPAGNAYTGWHYKITITLGNVKRGERVQSYEQIVRPILGQALVDLDLVPEGEPGEPSSVPAPGVTSINGETGAVNLVIPDVPVQSVNGQIGDVALDIPDPALMPAAGRQAIGKGELAVSVLHHGAVGDGVTDDSAALIAAVSAAAASGAELYWPAGTYRTYDQNIPGLHSVRHSGPGALRNGSAYFYPDPVAGQTNTLYVTPTGDDANDGTHLYKPFREIRAAMAALEKYGPTLAGSWVIRVLGGTYKGGIRVPVWRAPGQGDYLKIVGDTVGHPNVPTVIVDKAADTAQTYGILAENGAWLWLEDILVTGAFGNAIDIRRGGAIQRRNVHVTGAAVGVSLNSGIMDYSRGGIVKDCTSYGISEMFNVIRSYDSAGAAGQGTIVRNCPVGLFSKAGGQGHFDYLEVEDCQIGVQLDRGSGNVGNLQLRRNQVGLVIKDSEIHSEAGIVWGTGTAANTRRIIAYGPAATESSLWGWSSATSGLTLRTGHRPPLIIASNYMGVTITNTTAQTQVYNFGVIIPMDRYAVRGKKLRMYAVGTTNNQLAQQFTLRMIVGGSTVGLINIPAGTASNTHFVFECTMTCSADGNTQKNIASVTGTAVPLSTYTTSTQDLTTADRSVRLDAVPYATTDSVTIHYCEVYG